MWASSYFQIPGMSWPREMRPTPIAPTLMRLEGALCPKTDAGTMAGKAAPAAMAAPPLRNLRRFNLLSPTLSIPTASVRELILECDLLRRLLRSDGKFCRKQALFLILSRVRAVHNV